MQFLKEQLSHARDLRIKDVRQAASNTELLGYSNKRYLVR